MRYSRVVLILVVAVAVVVVSLSVRTTGESGGNRVTTNQRQATNGNRNQPQPEPSPGDAQSLIDENSVLPAAKAFFGSRLGLTWYTDAEGMASRLFVSVVGLMEADFAFVDQLDPTVSGRVQLVATSHSEEQLSAFAAEGSDALTRFGVPGASVGVGISERSENGRPLIVVSADALPERVRAAIEMVVPNELLRFEVAPGNGMHRRVNRDSFPPYQAGLSYGSNIQSFCTTSFVLAGAFGQFGTTAGHCLPPGTGFSSYVGRRFVDNRIRRNIFYESDPDNIYADVLLYSLDAVTQYSRTATILVSDQLRRDVTARFNAPVPLGTSLCFVGLESDSVRCGNVNRRGDVFRDQAGRRTVEHDCIERLSEFGDSGAPMYAVGGPPGNTATAAGILSYGNSNVTCYSRDYFIEFFTDTIIATR